MRKELSEQLTSTYPKLFPGYEKNSQDPFGHWGFECGDGWYKILDKLCRNIQSHLDWKNHKEQNVKQVTVVQVKEKFGTLRFYYDGGDEYISGLVQMAESMSSITCEACGLPGEIFPKPTGKGVTSWIHTYCQSCEDRRIADAADFQDKDE